MSQTVIQPAASAIHPPKIEFAQTLPYALWVVALMAMIYMVGADEGASALVPGTIVHEFVHDGRHLLGFPCH